jgi:hypothetical protein
MLSVGSVKDLNCFFPMPFERHARITLTNEGHQAVKALYYNIEYRMEPTTLAPGTLYFHAQFRQAQPNHGWTSNWTRNGQPLVNKKTNLTGQEANHRRHRVRGLLPWRLGLQGPSFLVPSVRCAHRTKRQGRIPTERLPLSSGFAHGFQDVVQGDH